MHWLPLIRSERVSSREADPGNSADSSGAVDLNLAQFDFALPPDQIAQHPPAERDGGRLMLSNAGGASFDTAR